MKELILEQGSIEWHNERAGRVTGTSMQSAIGARFDAKKGAWVISETAASKKVQETLANKLIAERMTEVQIPDVSSAAIERGKELEPFAIDAAAKLKSIDYDICGMLICDDIPELGFSPDAVNRAGDLINGGLETKCPSSEKHVSYIRENQVPRDYFWQVLTPFICDDNVEWWDFVSYDDRNYEKPIFYIRTLRKDHEELIQQARDALKKFLRYVREEHEKITF